MDDATRRLMDDVNQGDRVKITLADAVPLYGTYWDVMKQEDGQWCVVITDAVLGRKHVGSATVETRVIKKMRLA